MLSVNGCPRLCSNCPNREVEGFYDHDSATGDLVARQSQYMNARFEFVKDEGETPDIPTQEFATTFVDAQGNKTMAFLPGVQLEDIAACEQPVVGSRSGVLWRKKHYDCGAQAVKLHQMRKRLKEA